MSRLNLFDSCISFEIQLRCFINNHMATKSSMIRARINPALKQEVDHILENLGLNTTQAISIFYYQIKINKGLPFHVGLPNKLTRETLEKSRRGEELTHCKDLDDLFDKLNI